MSRDIGLQAPVSEAATPPILRHEALGCDVALCPQHGSRHAHLNVVGKVYFCPLGGSAGMYWRAGKRDAMHAPLSWPKGM